MCDKPYTTGDKWNVSIVSGLIFWLIASPFGVNMMNKVTNSIGLNIADVKGCPNLGGLLVSSLVFTFIMRLLMETKNSKRCPTRYSSKDKWISSLIGGLLFMLISSPFFFQSVNSLTSMIGLTMADKTGCPNLGGLLLHTIIFTLLVRLLMR